MERYIVLFATDKRQFYLAGHLGRTGQVISETEISQQKLCEEILPSAVQIICPTPVSKMNSYHFDVSQLREAMQEEQLIFGGKFPDEWKHSFDCRGIAYYDLMEDEEVALQNAQITAEAVVSEVIRRSSCSVNGQKILITGYGRCARAAAEKLAALGGKITILARSRDARRQAAADGCIALDFACGPQEAFAAGTLINTVPACVVTDRILREMQRDALILDIASAPGGCDRTAAQTCGLQIISLPGLPAIYTPKSSAKILADAILRKTHSERSSDKEKPWIYQIVKSDMA